jgi:choline kinase
MNEARVMKAVILGAGRGDRLGRNIPKPMVILRENVTILDLQLKNLAEILHINDVVVVVGFLRQVIERRHPDLEYVYNDNYAATNTAASLQIGLQGIRNEDVLWLNGDLVFDPRILIPLAHNVLHNLIWVTTGKVGEEEVKYSLDRECHIKEISKSVKPSLGEAVGINFIKKNDLSVFRSCLEECTDLDYFERAIELAINKGVSFLPANVQESFCIEIDFEEDLQKARDFVKGLGNI